jgi:Icc-related predicted phosphoesterase
VRVAALYDIHGNDAALAAVLEEIETLAVDLIVVGGDIAGGPFPCETVDAVRALGDRAVAIRGNGERELV